jgi:hypothetical protein
MSELDTVIQTLERYISPLNARSMVQRASRDRPSSGRSGKAQTELVTALQKSIRLFLAEPELSRALRDLAKLCQPTAAARVQPCRLTIATEGDIITARMEARRICDEMQAKSFETQKVTTVVSELSRNIISYKSRVSPRARVPPRRDRQAAQRFKSSRRRSSSCGRASCVCPWSAYSIPSAAPK